MRTPIALALTCVTIAGIGSQAVLACGDKFLLVGRGLSFQRAYAAIHPASILIVLPPKSVKSAAVRDSGLQKALKLAGHRVQVVQQPASLEAILGRSPFAIVLAERAAVSAIRAAAAGSGQPAPSIVAVLEDASLSDLTTARQELDYVLNAPQPVSKILNLLDDVMQARLGRQSRAAGGN